MITFTCHCKNVTISLKKLPHQLRDCDCPMCNRLGALWGDYLLRDVTVESTIPTVTYLWGDGDYQMHHCGQCGCTTHYTPTITSVATEVGINFRLLDRRQLEQLPISQ